MGKGTTQAKTRDIRRLLRSSPVDLERVILFGSWARGDSLEDSDVDLVLVSPGFAKWKFPDRASRILRKCPLRRADLLCYTSEEFERKRREIGIVRDAVREGILIL